MGKRGRNDGIQIGRYLWEIFFEGGCWLTLLGDGWRRVGILSTLHDLAMQGLLRYHEKASSLYVPQ